MNIVVKENLDALSLSLSLSFSREKPIHSVKTNAFRRCGVINSLVLLYFLLFFIGFFSINYLNALYQFRIDAKSVLCVSLPKLNFFFKTWFTVNFPRPSTMHSISIVQECDERKATPCLLQPEASFVSRWNSLPSRHRVSIRRGTFPVSKRSACIYSCWYLFKWCSLITYILFFFLLCLQKYKFPSCEPEQRTILFDISIFDDHSSAKDIRL